MNWTLAVFAFFVIAAYAWLKLSDKKPAREKEGESADYPYQKKEGLFSAAERLFLGVLDQAVGQEARVFGKVRVADVVETKRGLPPGDQTRAFNKISGKHVDFALCRHDDSSVICVIELDDRSHRARNRQRRDAFLDGACKAAGVPLIHVPAKAGYSVDDVRRQIAPHLQVKDAPS